MRLIDGDALTETLGITDMDCNKCAWCDKEWSRCKRGSDFEDACCAIENAPTIEERKTDGFTTWEKSVADSYMVKDIIQKFHDYQVEWLKSHYDIELEPLLEEMIVRFLHDTANCYMMEEQP